MADFEDDADDELCFEFDGDLLDCIDNSCKDHDHGKYHHNKKRKLTVKEHKLRKANSSYTHKTAAHQRWKNALHKLKYLKDPWMDFPIGSLPVREAKRHRYNALRQKWIVDDVKVKMEEVPFNRGAMRECFRLKKLSNFVNDDWHHAANYVGKSYMEKVDRQVYFDDVKLQMDAKLWGEEYNRSNPVKKVDIFQMCVLEFLDRGEPIFYHLEHFIEGHYVKYNSNSGFVDDQIARNTPQAFSHYTFERSGHQLIVVDIQGVGDLYTDPQIHTAQGIGYGDGNLGPRGMALFFHSHRCNVICKALGLTEFDLSESEMRARERTSSSCSESGTVAIPKSKINPNPVSPVGLNSALAKLAHSFSTDERSERDSGVDQDLDETQESEEPLSPLVDRNEMKEPFRRPRQRYESSCSDSVDDFNAFSRELASRQRPSCCTHLMNELASTLGQVHYELAGLHESGRFIEDKISGVVDWEAALFHEECAAKLGYLPSVINLAKYCLGLPRDRLIECPVTSDNLTPEKGRQLFVQAANAGDRSAMIYLARSSDRGDGGERDWDQAAHWYEKVITAAKSYDPSDELDGDSSSPGFDSLQDDPLYILIARLAEMLHYGGNGLEKEPSRAGDLYAEAAELATEAMKGRLAAKYYELSEIAYGEVEEEE